MTRFQKVFRTVRIIVLSAAILAVAVYLSRGFFRLEEKKTDPYDRIRSRGYLVALTDENTLNYYISRGEPQGYQLDLLRSFGRHLNVPVRVISSNNVSELLYYLNHNIADIIALNIPVNRQNSRLLSFSAPFGETRLVLVQNKTSGRKIIRNYEDFAKTDTITVRENSFMTPLLHLFLKRTENIPAIRYIRDITDEELIEMVSEGSVPYAICPENTVMVYKRHFMNIDSYMIAAPLYAYGWGVTPRSDTLIYKINEWIAEIRKTRTLKKIYLNYFDNQKVVNNLKSDYVSLRGSKLSPFDRDLRTMSRWIMWDWRLLASLVYQESNFRTGQISSKNATGLMQLIPETAAMMGMDSSSTPSQQLSAGVRYLRHINGLLPDSIIDPTERISFILAAYNVGIGRILKARQKAIEYGKDPNRWHGSVDYYLLRRSRSDPHNRGNEEQDLIIDYKTEGFVDDILNRYYHYRNLVPE